jgi:hypothetical protein
MRIGRVTDFVDRLYRRVHRRIETDGEIRTGNVLVDRTRDADAGDIKFIGEDLCSIERTITTDHHQPVNSALAEIRIGFFPSFRSPEFILSGRLQNRATALDDIGHTAGIHRLDVIIYHARIATNDPKNFQVMIESGSYNGPDTCVHPGRISTGCQYADFGYFRGYSLSGHDETRFKLQAKTLNKSCF